MQFIFLLLQIIPALPGVIRAAESIHGAGNGSTKLQTALDLLSVIFPAIKTSIEAQPANQSKLISVINVIVAAITAAGTMNQPTPTTLDSSGG